MWLSFDSHPAIAHLSWEDRHRLSHSALKRLRQQPAFWIEGALASLISMAVCVVLFIQVADRDRILHWAMLGVPCLVLAVAFWWFFRLRSLFGQVLRHRLLEEGIRPRSCLECGHDLRRWRGEDCPSCGIDLIDIGAADEPVSSSEAVGSASE